MMKKNNKKQPGSIPENVVKTFSGKDLINELKRLMMVDQEQVKDVDTITDEIDNIIHCLCDPIREVTRRNTVAKLEGLMLSSKFPPNIYFLDQYARCLICSCRDQDIKYIEDVVEKLRMIVDNHAHIYYTNIIESYIACLAKLSVKQDPAGAMQTIFEIKTIGNATKAWDKSDNILEYCYALYNLCVKQSSAGDKRAYDTMRSIESIITANDKINNDNIFKYYLLAILILFIDKTISAEEAYNRMTEIALKSKIMEDENYLEHYKRIKQIMEDESEENYSQNEI